jgi:hypothetical protein
MTTCSLLDSFSESTKTILLGKITVSLYLYYPCCTSKPTLMSVIPFPVKISFLSCIPFQLFSVKFLIRSLILIICLISFLISLISFPISSFSSSLDFSSLLDLLPHLLVLCPHLWSFPLFLIQSLGFLLRSLPPKLIIIIFIFITVILFYFS